MIVDAASAAALIAKLERRDRLSLTEKAAMGDVLDAPRRYVSDSILCQPGDRPSRCSLLISGLTARYSLLSDGSRSFTQINLSGDFIDLHSLLMKQMDHGIIALTDVVAASARHEEIIRLADAYPHLGRLLWLETVVDGAIHREWLHRMATQHALGRMAHLFCELDARFKLVGLSTDDSYDLPITQHDLAAFLGLSAVHVNRTLMELRRLGLILWQGGRLVIVDHARLCDFAEFDPTYLRLDRAPV
jgi:CRP-like cAMP-binding protein